MANMPQSGALGMCKKAKKKMKEPFSSK